MTERESIGSLTLRVVTAGVSVAMLLLSSCSPPGMLYNSLFGCGVLGLLLALTAK